MPISEILSAVAFTTCVFFYLYIIGSFFRVTVYPLVHRVTLHEGFQNYLINGYLDHIVVILAAAFWLLISVKSRTVRYYSSVSYGSFGIIVAFINPENIIFDLVGLLSLPLIICIALYYHRRHKGFLHFNAKLALVYASLVVIAFSAISILLLLLTIFSDFDYLSAAENSLTYELFLLFSSFSTLYIFLLVFCIPINTIFKELWRIFKLRIREDVHQVQVGYYENNKLKTHTKIGFLLFSMAVSIVLVIIPQHPLVNPDNQNIGVDTWYYVTWIGELEKSESLSQFVYQAFVVQGLNGDRSLFLILLFLVYQVVGGNLSEVIEHSPIIFGPGLVLALYFLTLELMRNEKIAVIAGFLGAVSFHTLVGVYAGFYANWLALIIGYISIVFLFRYLRSGRILDIVAFSTLLIVVLLTHTYTWTIVAAVAAIFLVTMLVLYSKRKKENNSNYDAGSPFIKRRIIWLLIFGITVSVAVDITKALSTGSSGGLERDIEIAQTRLGIEEFNLRWQTLSTTMHDSFGGVFSNFIILLLALFWILTSNIREPAAMFLMICFSLGLLPLLVGSLTIQARVLYDMPIEIPAAISLYYIARRTGSLLVPLAGYTWLVAISLFAVINFYLIPITGIS